MLGGHALHFAFFGIFVRCLPRRFLNLSVRMSIETGLQLTLFLINGVITFACLNIFSNVHPVASLFVGWFSLNSPWCWIVDILLLLFGLSEFAIVGLFENT